jgi:hypothetical protein
MMVRELLKRLEKLNKIKKQYSKTSNRKDASRRKTQVAAIESGKTNFESIDLFSELKKPVTEIETIATIETGEAVELQPSQQSPTQKKERLKANR